MKIVDVELTLFRWDGIPPVVYGPNIRMPGGSSTLGLLAISTDDGITGHSFLGGATRGAVDVALWDLAGKIAGLPIHQLLGSYRDSIPAYASSQALGSPEEYCEQALFYKSRGWQAYKIHPATSLAERHRGLH